MDKQIDRFQVARSYLAADKARETARNISIPNAQRVSVFRSISSSFDSIKDEELADLVTDEDRLNRLYGHSWIEKNIDLKYVGGWPQVGDLEKDWCQGSVVDVARQVSLNRDAGKQHVQRIYEMIPIIEEILTLFPPILVQGGEIRQEDDLLFLPFDADDGSHRCIAAVLAGRKKIHAYVGAM